MSRGALDGIVVVDLSRVLGGPYCTQILADHGAEVIKVEPPAGDDTRRWGPPFIGDMAAYFSGVNRNKEGMVLDLSTERGRQVLMTLLVGADVLVENFKPGTLARWGIDYETVLAKRFPGLVHCAISGFGATGPMGGLPGYDAVIQAMAGLMSVNGQAGGEATRIGVPIVDMVTGMNAAIGILMALHERASSGRGQSLDIALYDSGVSFLHPHLPNYYADGTLPKLTGNDHPNIAPYSTYKTANGPIFLAIGNNRQFARLCELLGAPQLADDPRFKDNATRCGNRPALRDCLEALLVNHTSVELAQKLIHAGVPAGPVQSVADVVKHAHTEHRQMLVDIGNYRGTGSPIKLSRTPPTYRLPPPAQGQHSRQILTRLGFDEDVQDALFTDGVAE